LPLLEVVRMEIGDASGAAQTRGIDLGLMHADDVHVDGNREALRILLRNLLDNAIKYTPPGGTVDLEVRRTADGVTLGVDDSGPGIAPAERARALDRFHRGASRATSGSGLGLAIVKAIADLHRAELSMASSARLGGLRVELRMRAHDAAPRRPDGSALSAASDTP